MKKYLIYIVAAIALAVIVWIIYEKLESLQNQESIRSIVEMETGSTAQPLNSAVNAVDSAVVAVEPPSEPRYEVLVSEVNSALKEYNSMAQEGTGYSAVTNGVTLLRPEDGEIKVDVPSSTFYCNIKDVIFRYEVGFNENQTFVTRNIIIECKVAAQARKLMENGNYIDERFRMRTLCIRSSNEHITKTTIPVYSKKHGTQVLKALAALRKYYERKR